MCYTIHKVWLRVPQQIALNLSGDGTSIAPDPCPHPSKCSKLTLWINRLSCIFTMVEETLPNKPSQMLKIDSKLRIFMRYLNHGWRIFFKSSSLICSKLTVELRFFIDIFTAAEENFQIHLSQVLKIDSWINTFSIDIFSMVEENLQIKPSEMLKTDSKLRIFRWYLHHGWSFSNPALPYAQNWLLD